MLVAVILIATVIITYSAIRSSPVSDIPQVLSAIDETNFALKQILSFTIGYYGSVLQVTGNATYAKMLAENYLYSGLANIAKMHPDWGVSFNVDAMSLQARWFEKVSYSMGDLKVSYNLTGLGIYGVSYGVTCKLNVNVIGTVNGKAYMRITKDENESLINLGKSNFKFYRYDYDSSIWECVNPAIEPTALSDGTYIIDLPSGVDPDSYMIQVEDQRGIIVVASSYTRYTYTLDWNPKITLINRESFEGSWPPSGWSSTGNWGKSSPPYEGTYSARFSGQNPGASGNLTTCDLNCTGASAIYVEFWFRWDNCLTDGGDELLLQYYDGASWITIGNLIPSSSTGKWAYYQQKITNSQFFKANFKIRWAARGIEKDKYLYIDCVTVKKEISLLTPSEPIVIELLQNGTMRWLGQNLRFATQAKPVPPIPVKSIRVNQTINGVNCEVPFQIEDWASDYKIPLGLASNMSVFGNRHMLVFLVNRDVSEVTIWWNGSDTTVQTSYAYVNRFFNDQPPIGNSEVGTLRNGRMTLTIDASGNSFLAKSRVTTTGIEVIARFMRVNGEWSIYGSNPAYAIYNGVVRDIVHAEAEWSGGVDDDGGCYNFYAHIVITLPANTTYYTYQLHLIFIESTDKPRTITDLCPIRLSTTASDTFSALTENGTLELYPRVSTLSGTFYNMSNVWQHRWSQLKSQSLNRGFGIMFPENSNVKLYHFDSMASGKTGCLSVSASGKTLEFLPVKLSQVTGFTSSLGICWYGAVVTLDNTTPIYQTVNNVPTGLWVLVAHPPVISLVAEG